MLVDSMASVVVEANGGPRMLDMRSQETTQVGCSPLPRVRISQSLFLFLPRLLLGYGFGPDHANGHPARGAPHLGCLVYILCNSSAAQLHHIFGGYYRNETDHWKWAAPTELQSWMVGLSISTLFVVEDPMRRDTAAPRFGVWRLVIVSASGGCRFMLTAPLADFI